jgi:hypothetical protein
LADAKAGDTMILILPLASEVKLEVFVVILELAESKESITIEAETVREAIKFAKESRITIPTEVDCPAVNADIEEILSVDVVEHTWLFATTMTFQSKKRDSIVIKSRGLAKIEPPMSSLEYMFTLGMG